MDSINIVNEKSVLLEQDTVRLTEKKEWLFCKIANINSYRAHRILIKQHNLESLANDRPQSVKANMRNKKAYNEIARERYHSVMCFYLNRDVQLLEPGFIIQPHLSWIVATPDGLISHASTNNDAIGILRIVYPRSLQNSDVEDISISS